MPPRGEIASLRFPVPRVASSAGPASRGIEPRRIAGRWIDARADLIHTLFRGFHTVFRGSCSAFALDQPIAIRAQRFVDGFGCVPTATLHRQCEDSRHVPTGTRSRFQKPHRLTNQRTHVEIVAVLARNVTPISGADARTPRRFSTSARPALVAHSTQARLIRRGVTPSRSWVSQNQDRSFGSIGSARS